MIERVIDISEKAVRLRVKLDQLVIEQEKGDAPTVPLDEVAVVVVSHPQVSFTHAVVAGLAERGGMLVVCDGKHQPVGMMLPLQAHHLQSERFARQAEASLPTKKRVWQQIVKAKVRVQGRLLDQLRHKDHGLLAMAERVRSGDAGGVESRAARIYWPALFADPMFLRNRDADDQNRHLNYGYAVVRAIVARALCAAGLHPSLGVHHHNRYDTFPLASDVMEPFRALVDRAVAIHITQAPPDAPFDKKAKGVMLTALTGKLDFQGEQRSIFDTASRTASSLAQVYMGQRKDILLPEIL